MRNLRKASRIYKRKSRSNLETFIILIGAIIILGVAFYLARDRGYLPPENEITIEEKEEVPGREVPVESLSNIIVEKIEENTKVVEKEVAEKEIAVGGGILPRTNIIAMAPVNSAVRITCEEVNPVKMTQSSLE